MSPLDIHELSTIEASRFTTEAEQRLRPAYLMDGMDEQERRIRRLMDAGISEPEACRIVAEAGNEMEAA